MSSVQVRCVCRVVAFVAAVSLVCASGPPTGAQPRESNPAAGIDLGARGGFAPGGSVRRAPTEETKESPIEFSARGGFATDYIYRGTTLSDHRPAAGAAFEATASGFFYAAARSASVKLPSQPAAEITMSGGVRPTLGNVTFDFGWTRFPYPGEIASAGHVRGHRVLGGRRPCRYQDR